MMTKKVVSILYLLVVQLFSYMGTFLLLLRNYMMLYHIHMSLLDPNIFEGLDCGLTEALAGTGIRTAEGKGEAAVERC